MEKTTAILFVPDNNEDMDTSSSRPRSSRRAEPSSNSQDIIILQSYLMKNKSIDNDKHNNPTGICNDIVSESTNGNSPETTIYHSILTPEEDCSESCDNGNDINDEIDSFDNEFYTVPCPTLLIRSFI